MSLTLPENNVRNWYKYDVIFSIELLESYIEGIEKQADESVIRFEQEKQTHVLEDRPAEGYARVVDVHQGLDDESWDLQSIFKEYFPSLQRRSALLTLCGFFEHELDKLCFLYKSEKNIKLSLIDLKDKGIDRSTAYLAKIANINTFKNSQEWQQIKRIQNIRNVIVHRSGELHEHNNKSVKDAIAYIKEIETLSGETEIVIGKGFLTYVVNIYKEYFRNIGESIESTEKA